MTTYIVHISRDGRRIDSTEFGPRSYKKALAFAVDHEKRGYSYYIEAWTR